MVYRGLTDISCSGTGIANCNVVVVNGGTYNSGLMCERCADGFGLWTYTPASPDTTGNGNCIAIQATNTFSVTLNAAKAETATGCHFGFKVSGGACVAVSVTDGQVAVAGCNSYGSKGECISCVAGHKLWTSFYPNSTVNTVDWIQVCHPKPTKYKSVWIIDGAGYARECDYNFSGATKAVYNARPDQQQGQICSDGATESEVVPDFDTLYDEYDERMNP